MKCPMFETGEAGLYQTPDTEWRECLREECAWWSSEADACAAMIIAGSLAGLVAIGDALIDKLPREFTPRST